MINVGDKIELTAYRPVEVEVIDTHTAEPDVGILGESGWWCAGPNYDGEDDDLFFLSHEGVVYGKGEHGWEIPVGSHAGLQAAAIEAAMGDMP